MFAHLGRSSLYGQRMNAQEGSAGVCYGTVTTVTVFGPTQKTQI